MEEVGGYTLGERLGAGSGSRVYLAHPSERPDLLVAVKRLAAASSPEALTDLHREAEVLERLSHPSIVRLFDAVDDDGRIALIIPYLAGGSLADRLRSGRAQLAPPWVGRGKALVRPRSLGSDTSSIEVVRVLTEHSRPGYPYRGQDTASVRTHERQGAQPCVVSIRSFCPQ